MAGQEHHLPDIRIPDIFESFVTPFPAVNAHYEDVRQCNYGPKQRQRVDGADFAYFAAVFLPDATCTKLRTAIDWLNWVFVFDDQIDDGVLERRNVNIEHYIQRTAAVLDEDARSEDGNLGQESVLGDIWNRIRQDENCTKGAKRRWAKAMRSYLDGVQDSLQFKPCASLDETIKSYFEHRFYNVGVLPLFSFVEYGYDLDLPDEVFDHPVILNIHRIAIELGLLANDSVSYHREKSLGYHHNLIAYCVQHGMTEQAAYDYLQTKLREHYQQWDEAVASLPSWGATVDATVRRYIQGVADVVTANASWSFRTQRYFGKDGDVVRRTRVLPKTIEWLPSVELEDELLVVVE